MEKGNMIRNQNNSVGKRLNIIVLGHVDNDNVSKFIQILDKYNIKSKILFNHYGRPSKCKRELDKWFEETPTEHPIITKLKRADTYLEEDLKKFKEKFRQE